MKLYLLGLIFVMCALALPAAASAETIKMSTTTSTRDSGLLDVLLPEFSKDTGIEVQVIAKGTGAAIRDGIDGNVDVIFVHDPEREIEFVADGFGTRRYEVMHNDFVLVGPAADPAGVKGQSIVVAFQRIAARQADFISRGDDSGTHAKELAIWKQTGLPMSRHEQKIQRAGGEALITVEAPQGVWYKSIGQGMGKALLMADETQAYCLADRGTFIQQKFDKTPPSSLEILVQGDKELLNYYGVIPVNPARHPLVKIEAATKFAEWLVSLKGQQAIARYNLAGQQLFFPDAIVDAK